MPGEVSEFEQAYGHQLVVASTIRLGISGTAVLACPHMGKKAKYTSQSLSMAISIGDEVGACLVLV